MNPLKKLAGQTAIYGLPTIVGRLLNYFLVPLYTYSFPPQEFGIVTEVMAYVPLILVILTFGMETAFFRFATLHKGHKDVFSSAFYFVLSLSSLFLLLSLSMSGPIRDLLNYSNKENIIIQACVIIFFDAISAIPFTRLRQENKAKIFAFLKSFNIFINIILNVFFIYFCKKAFESNIETGITGILGDLYSPEIGIGYIFISNLAASSLTFLLLMYLVRIPSSTIDTGLLKEMLKYSWPLLLAGLAGMVNETIDRVLLRYLLPDNVNKLAEIGIYGACYKISILMTIFIQTYRFAAEPFFFAMGKSSQSKKMYADTMKVFFIFCLMIFLGTMLYLEIIQLLIPDSYRSGLHIVPILLLANMFLGVYFNLSIWYKISGQTKFGAYFSIGGAILTLGLNFILIPRIGYTGAAWTTLACYFSMMAASYITGQRYFPVNYDLRKMIGYFAVSMLIFFISILLSIQSTVGSLIVNTLLLFSFIMIIAYFERSFFNQLFRNKLRYDTD